MLCWCSRISQWFPQIYLDSRTSASWNADQRKQTTEDIKTQYALLSPGKGKRVKSAWTQKETGGGNDAAISKFNGLRTASFIHLLLLEGSFDTFTHHWVSSALQRDRSHSSQNIFQASDQVKTLKGSNIFLLTQNKTGHHQLLPTAEELPSLLEDTLDFPGIDQTGSCKQFLQAEYQPCFAVRFIVQNHKWEAEIWGNYKVTQEVCSSAGRKTQVSWLLTPTNFFLSATTEATLPTVFHSPNRRLFVCRNSFIYYLFFGSVLLKKLFQNCSKNGISALNCPLSALIFCARYWIYIANIGQHFSAVLLTNRSPFHLAMPYLAEVF